MDELFEIGVSQVGHAGESPKGSSSSEKYSEVAPGSPETEDANASG